MASIFFFEATITAEVYHDIIQQFIALLDKDEHDTVFQQHNASRMPKDKMSFSAEFFGGVNLQMATM